MPARAALDVVAEAMGAVVTRPMTKGQVSAAVTERVPEGLSGWCHQCQARHVFEQLFRLAGLPAGLQLEPGRSPTTFAPIEGWPGVPRQPADTASLVETYLALLGPATMAQAAGYLGTTQAEVRPAWPGGLAEVRVEGRSAWVPGAALQALREAPPARVVRLLPPSDPYLEAGDRTLLVPDKSHQRALWRVLGPPGAVLVDGEIAGLWRARAGGRGRLEITVSPFRAVPTPTRAAVEDEAGRVAAVSGAAAVDVRYQAA